MDLRRLDGMNRAWKIHPPAHVSLAVKEGGGQQSASDAEFDSLMASVPQRELRIQNG